MAAEKSRSGVQQSRHSVLNLSTRWQYRASKNAIIVTVSCCFFGLHSAHSMPAPGRSTPNPDDGALGLSYLSHSSRTQVQVPSLESTMSVPVDSIGQDAGAASIATAGAENLPVPAVTHWGMVIMSLLLLTLAKIRSRQWQEE